jgi:hypothetical protein
LAAAVFTVVCLTALFGSYAIQLAQLFVPTIGAVYGLVGIACGYQCRKDAYWTAAGLSLVGALITLAISATILSY